MALAAGVMVLCGGILIAANAVNGVNRDGERLVLRKLAYDAKYDAGVPYFRTLHALGSSNHVCVTVKTAAIDNLHDRTTALRHGGVNLKLTFGDGKSSEIALNRGHRFDSFAAGREMNFVFPLPYGYTPFDIKSAALAITAGADGKYDDWLCERATLSFLLGGKQVRIASTDEAARFGSANGMLRSIALTDRREKNLTYQQTHLLYDRMLELAENGVTNFDDAALKTKTLAALNFANATALYMDVETISSTRSAELHRDLPEAMQDEEMNFNGTLQVSVQFTTPLSDGSYTKQYTLDTPGKDDFELSGKSTFRMEMPEGKCVFDVDAVTLTTSDLSDAWAPRFVRLYLTPDFDKEIELARLTDTYLEKQYDSCIFATGMLDTPIAFDLTALNAVPAIERESIQKNYGVAMTETADSMYFEKQSYYSRRSRFYAQMAREQAK